MSYGLYIEEKGCWVSEYDPNGNGGAGHVKLAFESALARRFDTSAAAVMCWGQQSTLVPLRDDGKPNRPLTAWTVTIKEILPCRAPGRSEP